MKGLLFLSLFLFLSKFFSLANAKYNAIFSFGDSYTDTGNFAVLTNSPGSPPYGMTYFGHPAGRSSDGRLVIDFIAQAFGLPLVPPYLAKSNNYNQGANFAVFGATALGSQNNTSTKAQQQGTSLDVQFQWFEELKPSLCNTPQACKDLFAQSLFLVGEIGGNDHNFMLMAGKTVQEVASIVPKIIAAISAVAEKLINEGATTLVVPGILPTGCVPVILTRFPSQNKDDYEPNTGCLKNYNGLSSLHDALLRNAVTDLRAKYPQARIIFAEYYRAVIDFLSNPANFGFTGGSLKVCCGGGGPYNYNFSASCGGPGASACSDPSTYVNWDGVHMTEAAFKQVATGWLNGPYADPPLSSVPSYQLAH
ncbi:GDSL esterase/lipase At1g28600-like [Typha latifolia]|uniref:GDSL esterase/lipase At1g28600-like n=1 Tax=Typha latifolia TaxID=4733 RepID=UPI003C2AC621